MPTVTPTDFHVASLDIIGRGKHDFLNDTLKVYLTNVVPNEGSHSVKADVAEIASGNGYTAGGYEIPVTSVTQTAGSTSIALDQTPIDIQATGGNIGPVRYAIIYNDTEANDALLFSLDYGSEFTISEGETLRITPPANLIVGSFS